MQEMKGRWHSVLTETARCDDDVTYANCSSSMAACCCNISTDDGTYSLDAANTKLSIWSYVNPPNEMVYMSDYIVMLGGFCVADVNSMSEISVAALCWHC